MNKLDLINRYLREDSKKKREAQWDKVRELLKKNRKEEENNV